MRSFGKNILKKKPNPNGGLDSAYKNPFYASNYTTFHHFTQMNIHRNGGKQSPPVSGQQLNPKSYISV